MKQASERKHGSPDPSRYRNPDSDPRGAWLASDLTIAVDRPSLVYEFLGSLPPKGRSWRFGRERMERLHADGRIVTRASGSPVLKRYLAEAGSAPREEDPEGAASLSVPAYIREISYILARKLALQPATLSDFEWRDLERALAAACEGLGFDTRLTRPGKDGGFDIELRLGDARYLIEVKHWSTPNRVGLGPVSHFADIVLSEGASRGLLLSSSGFRKPVLAQRLEITPSRIALGDGRKIIGLCQSYVRREEGLWHPSTDLEELLFLETA